MREIFRRNQYPQHFIDQYIKVFLNKKMESETKANVQKQKLIISLLFLGKYSNDLKKKILALAAEHLKSNFKIDVIWNSPRTLRNFFSSKDRLPMYLRSKVLYRFTCNGCNSIYLGKTKRHFLVRAYEHLGLSVRTGKEFKYNPKNSNNTSVLDHIHQSNQCNGNMDSFELIGGARNDFFLRIKESLLIKKVKPTLLNRNGRSIPLHLFD